MELEKILRIDENLEHDRDVIERLMDINLGGKISAYLRKFDGKPDARGRIELNLSFNSHRKFDGKLIITLDNEIYRYEREDYRKLDDLINHLFKHFKESLADH